MPSKLQDRMLEDMPNRRHMPGRMHMPAGISERMLSRLQGRMPECTSELNVSEDMPFFSYILFVIFSYFLFCSALLCSSLAGVKSSPAEFVLL